MAMDADEIRARRRREWGAAAAGWSRVRRESSPTQPVSDQLVEVTGIGPGDRVLDLACGAGDPTLTVAAAVGPQGYVLGLDLSLEMLEQGRERARERGLENVEFRSIEDESDLDVPDASFDAAVCRFGLMFMPDPVGAVAALARAVKPGGRIAASTWGPPERVPFLNMEMHIVERHVPTAVLDSGGPGPLSLPSPHALAGVFAEAGLTDVEVTFLDVVTGEAPDPETYWQRRAQSAGPLVLALRSLTEEQREAVHQDALRTYTELCPDGPVEVHGEALVAVGVVE